MNLRKTPRKTPDDNRGTPYCGKCGAEKVWTREWSDGYDRWTGEPIRWHQWVCPRWPENPEQHDLGDAYRRVVEADR